MLALIGNLSPGELVVVALLAIVIFGGRLPEAAARAVHMVRKFRQGLNDLKRETGIDRELRTLQYEIRDAERAARTSNPFAPEPPAGIEQRKTPGEASPVSEGDGEGPEVPAEDSHQTPSSAAGPAAGSASDPSSAEVSEPATPHEGPGRSEESRKEA